MLRKWNSQTLLVGCFYIGIATLGGIPGGSVEKNPSANAGDVSPIPGIGKIPWRRKWQPIPVFLPGELQGQRSPAGYSAEGHTESDKTEVIQHMHTQDLVFFC